MTTIQLGKILLTKTLMDIMEILHLLFKKTKNSPSKHILESVLPKNTSKMALNAHHKWETTIPSEILVKVLFYMKVPTSKITKAQLNIQF